MNMQYIPFDIFESFIQRYRNMIRIVGSVRWKTKNSYVFNNFFFSILVIRMPCINIDLMIFSLSTSNFKHCNLNSTYIGNKIVYHMNNFHL